MGATSWGWEPSTVAPTTRSIATTAPLQGGGNLSADRTLTIDAATQSAAGSMSASDKTKLDSVASGATNTPLSNATPAALGTASAGVSTSAARGDHVHASPSPGIVIPFQTVYVTPSRWITGINTQYGSVSSGTGTRTDGYHLFLPANTTWRLEMITSYSYGGGGQLRFSVETASAWGGTYSEAAFVTTTSGGINSVFTTTLTVGGSDVVAVFNCRHATSGINNVICRFFQVG